jgi:hypothetical protein
MLKVWVGLEARSFLQASIETVSFPHSSYFRQALTLVRSNDVSSTTNSHQTYDLAFKRPTNE